MAKHGECSRPHSGLLPNGLLPNETASVIRVLDLERWQKAEERTGELIACIQPNTPSEERRNAVAEYVRGLIMKCFPCKVFTFGSVPLKTYLPDGDIDLIVFSDDQNLKEAWAHQVRDMLENEKKNKNAKFRVTEVKYIQATVKIIKCVVENIVVDISFNQLDGLVTLCFLDEVDYLINQNHLFKRSIILIKAWCYYESRILGARHGLISTFALEMLVLYIFRVFNNSFTGPLEVLYRFLEFYSKFDWDNFCVSLWGAVPISSLPYEAVAPPRKDGGELLLSKLILDCRSFYAGFLVGQENQGLPFKSKAFNVIDPFCTNSNLGRSVNEGNFIRVRSAFAFGAESLARLLDCPKEDLFCEVNRFFLNTWKWHGSGHGPDVPRNDLWRWRLSNPGNQHGSENVRNNSSGKRNDVSSGQYFATGTGTGTFDASTSHFSIDEGLDNGDSGQNFDLPEVLDHSENLSTTDSSGVAFVEPSEHKPDILNSDFASHWQNLQYGWSCQNSQHHARLSYSSHVVVPPVYGRPLSNNLNLFAQFVNYVPHIVPVSNRPTSAYQQYVDDMTRYWSGTGSLLPNSDLMFRSSM